MLFVARANNRFPQHVHARVYAHVYFVHARTNAPKRIHRDFTIFVWGNTNIPTISLPAWTRLSICLLSLRSLDALYVSGNRSRSGTDLWRGGTPRTTVDEVEAPDLRPSVGHLSRHNAAVATVSGRGELARCALCFCVCCTAFGLYCSP